MTIPDHILFYVRIFVFEASLQKKIFFSEMPVQNPFSSPPPPKDRNLKNFKVQSVIAFTQMLLTEICDPLFMILLKEKKN